MIVFFFKLKKFFLNLCKTFYNYFFFFKLFFFILRYLSIKIKSFNIKDSTKLFDIDLNMIINVLRKFIKNIINPVYILQRF